MNLPNLKYFYNNKLTVLDVVAFDFPFFTRGDEKSSGPKLIEEIDTLEKVLDCCKQNKCKKVRLIGKSLGAIIAGEYLNKLPKEQKDKYELIIFGYVTGYINIKSFTGKVTIIQGSKDKFGDAEAVKKDIKGIATDDIQYISVKGADHSYRIPETKKAVFEDEAVKLAFE